VNGSSSDSKRRDEYPNPCLARFLRRTKIGRKKVRIHLVRDWLLMPESIRRKLLPSLEPVPMKQALRAIGRMLPERRRS
jgi:hypothetical protein